MNNNDKFLLGIFISLAVTEKQPHPTPSHSSHKLINFVDIKHFIAVVRKLSESFKIIYLKFTPSSMHVKDVESF